MSRVTNLILTCSLGEREKYIISQINKFKINGNSLGIVSINDDKLPKGWYGGTKYMECNIFIGAFNYIDLRKFVEHLKSIKWEDPEDVQLIIREQDDFGFRIVNIFR